MSTYKKEVGTAVQNFTNDPDNPITGQVWYNVTAAEFRYQEQVVGNAWSTANNMNTARTNLAGSSGTNYTSALAFGGSNPPPNTALTEQYDGTSWTTLSATLASAVENNGGCGTTSLALSTGGSGGTTATEEYTGAGPVTKTITAS